MSREKYNAMEKLAILEEVSRWGDWFSSSCEEVWN